MMGQDSLQGKTTGALYEVCMNFRGVICEFFVKKVSQITKQGVSACASYLSTLDRLPVGLIA